MLPRIVCEDICQIIHKKINNRVLTEVRHFLYRHAEYFVLNEAEYTALRQKGDHEYFLFTFIDSILDQLPDRQIDDILILDWYKDYNFTEFQKKNYAPIRKLLNRYTQLM